MGIPVIVTVGREFCSGGAEIASKLAEQLGIAYYDKQIIDHTAQVLKTSVDQIRRHDEKPVPYMDLVGYQYNTGLYAEDPSLMLPLGIRVANAQFDLVKQYAESGSGVIVGRCADYVLRDRENVLSVFIHASKDFRLARAKRLYGLDGTAAKKLIRRTDRVRANYYENYTQRQWGGTDTYMLCLDSGKLGVDGCVQTIAAAIESISK